MWKIQLNFHIIVAWSIVAWSLEIHLKNKHKSYNTMLLMNNYQNNPSKMAFFGEKLHFISVVGWILL